MRRDLLECLALGALTYLFRIVVQSQFGYRVGLFVAIGFCVPAAVLLLRHQDRRQQPREGQPRELTRDTHEVIE
jgi:hypothetical protein